jgi:hypothetical protein
VYDYNRPLDATITPDFVKTEALAGTSGSKVFTAVLTVLPGQINTSIGLSISGLAGSTYHTQFWVAENTTPTIQAAAVRSNGTTKPCPAINLAFGYVSPNECVNQGSTLELSLIPVGATPDAHGIYDGTNYHIIWGDGAVLNWNSTAAELVPPAGLLQHTFSGPANCTYEVIVKVTSSCSPLVVKNFGTKIVIHGRDILDDGDGDLLIEENGTGITGTIEVCEGNSHIITLRDISTWNCQSPTWLDLSPAPHNDAPRTIQWIYGENSGGAVQNTIGTAMGTGITDPVVIDGVHNATTVDGYVGDAVIDITSIGELSKAIVIPATCRDGEYFDVYLRNWNKCNPYLGGAGDPPVITHIRILVVAAPALPIAPSRTICFGEITTLTAAHGTPAGTVLSWYTNADKTGFLIANSLYTPVIATPGTYTYYVADRGSVSGLLCEGPVTEVTLTVVPVIANNTIAAVQTICNGQTPAALTGTLPTGGTGTFTYQWQSSTTSAIAGFAAASGTNNTQNYTPAGAFTQNTWYRRVITSGVCSSTSPAIQITILPAIGNNTVAAAQSICSGQTPAALTGTLPTGGSGAYTYQWQSSTTSAIAGFAAASGTNNTQNYTPGAMAATTWYRRIVTSGPCTGTQGHTSPAIQITVLPVIANNSVATAQTICNGQTPAALTGTLPTGGSGAYTYQWQRSTTSAVAGFGAAPGTNNAQNYTPGALATTTWYRRSVTSGACTSFSTAIEITVLPSIANNTVSAVQTICNGQTPAALTGTLPTGGSGAYTYQWQSSTTSAVAGFAAASGTNNTQNYTPAGAFTQTTWYRRVVTSGACSATSAAIQITVLPAIGNNTVSIAQTICNGQTPAALTGTLPTGGNGTFTYLWESSTTSAVAGFAASSGTNNTQNYSPGALATTTWYRRTVTSGPCTGSQGHTSAAIQITVQPSIANNTVSAAQTICNGQTPAALTGTLPTGGSGAYTYQWQSSTTSAVAGFAAASGTNNALNYTPAGAFTQTTWYRRVVTSGACSSTSVAIEITVLPPLGNNNIGTVQSICNLSTPAPLTGSLPTGGNGAYTYIWEWSITSAIAGFAPAGGTNNTQNYTPSGAYTQNTWFRRVVTSGPCAGAQGSTSAVIQITVGSTPISASLTGSGNACFGATSTIKSVITGGAPPYTIAYNRNGAAQVPLTPYTSNTNHSVGVLPVGAHTFHIVSVTDDCGNVVPLAGLPVDYTITIFETPVAAAGVNQNICGSKTTTLAAVATVGTGTWTLTGVNPGTITGWGATSANNPSIQWSAIFLYVKLQRLA